MSRTVRVGLVLLRNNPEIARLLATRSCPERTEMFCEIVLELDLLNPVNVCQKIQRLGLSTYIPQNWPGEGNYLRHGPVSGYAYYALTDTNDRSYLEVFLHMSEERAAEYTQLIFDGILGGE